MALEKQEYGSIVAQAVINVGTDAALSLYGCSSAGLTTTTTLREYVFALNGEMSLLAAASRHIAVTVSQPRANTVRMARVVVDAGDTAAQIRVQLVDAAFAPADGAAGDVISVTVFRSNVPVS